MAGTDLVTVHGAAYPFFTLCSFLAALHNAAYTYDRGSPDVGAFETFWVSNREYAIQKCKDFYPDTFRVLIAIFLRTNTLTADDLAPFKKKKE